MLLLNSINSHSALSIFFADGHIPSPLTSMPRHPQTLRQSVLDVSDERQRTVVPTENAMSEFKEERFGRKF